MNSLNGYEIILASGSPRRKAFFKEMGLDFKNKVIPVNEDFPTGLNGVEIASHITRKKTVPFLDIVKEKQIIITADTIVWHDIATKSPISKEDIEAKITELEQQKLDKKASGKQKLKDLGLDDDEIKALTGA